MIDFRYLVVFLGAASLAFRFFQITRSARRQQQLKQGALGFVPCSRTRKLPPEHGNLPGAVAYLPLPPAPFAVRLHLIHKPNISFLANVSLS